MAASPPASSSSAWHRAEPNEVPGTVCHVIYRFALRCSVSSPWGCVSQGTVPCLFHEIQSCRGTELLEADVSSPTAHSRSCGPREGHLGDSQSARAARLRQQVSRQTLRCNPCVGPTHPWTLTSGGLECGSQLWGPTWPPAALRPRPGLPPAYSPGCPIFAQVPGSSHCGACCDSPSAGMSPPSQGWPLTHSGSALAVPEA